MNKYIKYGLIIIIGLILKSNIKILDTYNFGFIMGGIAVIPLWKDYYTNYK